MFLAQLCVYRGTLNWSKSTGEVRLVANACFLSRWNALPNVPRGTFGCGDWLVCRTGAAMMFHVELYRSLNPTILKQRLSTRGWHPSATGLDSFPHGRFGPHSRAQDLRSTNGVAK